MVRRLTKEFRDRVRLNTPVKSVARRGKHVDVRVRDNSVERFDEVILAAHADQSLQLMEDLYDDERHTLSFFPYQHNEAVLHTDTSLLPDRRAAWAASLARGHRGWW
ncbi:MAG: FAD-dependent oxidoreductase [Gammaproteobacteria bacterium]